MHDKGNMRRGKFHGLTGGGEGKGGGARWGEWLRGWLILEKIYTCTIYILEMHIGKKKRILHHSSVQKKKKITNVQWAEKKNLVEMLPGLRA